MEWRPIEQDDLPYCYAAYRKGLMSTLGHEFIDGDMDSDEFDEAFQQLVAVEMGMGWTLLANTRRGFLPAGVVIAFPAHFNEAVAPFAIIYDMIWFPWATPRNVLESAVKFFHEVRTEVPLMDYARPQDEKFMDALCQHGVMRRVGTSYNVYRGGQPAAVYETARETH